MRTDLALGARDDSADRIRRDRAHEDTFYDTLSAPFAQSHESGRLSNDQ